MDADLRRWARRLREAEGDFQRLGVYNSYLLCINTPSLLLMDDTDCGLEEQTYAIIGAAIEVLNELGHGIHEKPYESTMRPQTLSA